MSIPSQVIICFILIATTGYAGDPIEDGHETPEILEVFACGDYCPGPEEKYLKRIYDGVTNKRECRKLGGRLYTYFAKGWYTVCEVR